jgi:SAM-dependent methyltransferase
MMKSINEVRDIFFTSILKANTKLLRVLPRSWRLLLKRLGVYKVVNRLITKSQGELIHQTNWVNVFEVNKDKTRRYWEKYRYLNKIKRICMLSPETKVLDVGCGISSVLHFVEGKKKWGIDPLVNEYKQLYEYPKDMVIDQGVGERLPYNNGSFDVCFCSNTLDHTESPQKVLSEIHRVLTDKGYCVLIVHVYSKDLEEDPVHPHRLTGEKVRFLIGSNFKTVFERESPAVDIYWYVLKDEGEDQGEPTKEELVWVLEKN